MQTTENQEVEVLDFTKEKGIVDQLISSFNDERTKCTERRKLRENRKNVAEMRANKELLEDETCIPDRTIDTNIRRSRTPYISYVMQAERTLVMTDINEPNYDTESLELWFTRGMHYPGWKTPWLRLIDAMHTHGGVAMEVCYDSTKPFNVGLEYIPRNELLIPETTRDIQKCPRLLRRYDLTMVGLDEMAAKFEFDPAALKEIKEKYKQRTDNCTIYRIYSKQDNAVFVTWYSQDFTSGWLKDPKPLEIGLFDIDFNMLHQMAMQPGWLDIAPNFAQPLLLKNYPIFWFKLDETEDEEVLKCQGRVALDLQTQEAMTSLLSSTVNACWRASNLYPTAENIPGDNPALGELGPIKPGVISSRKIILNQFPWPQNTILAVMQAMDMRKTQESGNTDFAAVARQDANKTKYEMELANKQANELGSVGLTVFSTPYLDTYGLAFLIAQHQALYGLCIPPVNFECLFRNYNLQPAGDIEIIKREKDKDNAKAFFEVVRGTPMANAILKFLFAKFFPDQMDEWEEMMNEEGKMQQLTQLVQQMTNVLQSIPVDDLTPDQQSGLQSIIAAAQNMVGASPDAGAAQQSNQAPQGAAGSGNSVQQ